MKFLSRRGEEVEKQKTYRLIKSGTPFPGNGLEGEGNREGRGVDSKWRRESSRVEEGRRENKGSRIARGMEEGSV